MRTITFHSTVRTTTLVFLLMVGGAVFAQANEPLTIAVKVAPPFVIEETDGDFTGISIALWERIAADSDLEYRYRATDLATLLEGVDRGDFDVGIGALTVNAEREARFDFTQPYFTSGLGIAVVAGDSPGWWLVVKRLVSPQFLGTALALIGVLLLSGFLVWWFERRHNTEQFGGQPAQGIGAGFWWAAVTMTTVGYGDKAPQTLGGRLVGVIWMFTAVIIISSFTASIASSLTVGKLQTRVSGPDDLPSAKVGSLPDSTSAAYLDTSGIPFSGFEALPAALDALARGALDAVVYDAPLLHYRIHERTAGDMLVLPGTFERQDYAFALPEGSALQESLNRSLLAQTTTSSWEEMLRQYLGDGYR